MKSPNVKPWDTQEQEILGHVLVEFNSVCTTSDNEEYKANLPFFLPLPNYAFLEPQECSISLASSLCFFHFARQAHELWERVTSFIVPIPWNPETSRNNMNRDIIGRTIITSLLFFYHRNSWPILRVQVYAGRKSVSIWKKELCWFTEFAKEKWLHSEPKMTGIPN